MIRIAICDDVSWYVEALAESITDWADVRKINVKLEKFRSGEEVLFDLEEKGDFVAVLIDIELEGINGLETALRLRAENGLVSIVFVSQYEQYFKELFQVYPYQFLEKPISRQKLYDVLDKVVKEQKIYYESFSFRYNRITFNIDLKHVLYFTSERRMIRILMEDRREHVFYGKLDELEGQLSGYNHHFMRIHQSYLVNERQIEEYHYKRIVMRNGDVLTVSRKMRNMVARRHMDLLAEKC